MAVWSISRVNPVAHEGAEALALILRARDAAAVPVAPWEAAHELQSRRHVDPACGHAAVAAGLAVWYVFLNWLHRDEVKTEPRRTWR